MITLNLKREPFWIDLLDGIRLHVRPATTAVIMAARAAVAKEAVSDDVQRGAAFLKNLGISAVLEWEGVGDAEGNPAAVTPEAVSALFELWPVADAFERQYLAPALLLEQEKNA